jgi:hypothetical protein
MKKAENLKRERVVQLFLDGEEKPFGEFTPPVKFILDTTKISDGKHSLKIVARSSNGKEGIKIIPFEVRNGPEISVIGLRDHDQVDDQLPITINAYGSETNDQFIINGSETPKAIPAWVWALLISFIGFAAYYLIMYWNPLNYKSFF